MSLQVLRLILSLKSPPEHSQSLRLSESPRLAYTGGKHSMAADTYTVEHWNLWQWVNVGSLQQVLVQVDYGWVVATIKDMWSTKSVPYSLPRLRIAQFYAIQVRRNRLMTTVPKQTNHNCVCWVRPRVCRCPRSHNVWSTTRHQPWQWLELNSLRFLDVEFWD